MVDWPQIDRSHLAAAVVGRASDGTPHTLHIERTYNMNAIPSIAIFLPFVILCIYFIVGA